MAGQKRRAPSSAAASSSEKVESSISISRQTSASWSRWQPMRFAALVACSAFIFQTPSSSVSGLSSSGVTMSYKPPVKSSVSKLRSSSRFPTDPARGGSSSSTRHSPSTRSPTSRSSFAGALAPPIGYVGTPDPAPVPTECFEQRMRNLVLGEDAAIRKKRQQQQQQTRTVQKPANLLSVETLADYKRVVADEKDRVVAVRFHGEWCRVSDL